MLCVCPRCYQGLGQLAGELKVMSTNYKEKDSDQLENIKIVLWVSLECSIFAKLMELLNVENVSN